MSSGGGVEREVMEEAERMIEGFRGRTLRQVRSEVLISIGGLMAELRDGRSREAAKRALALLIAYINYAEERARSRGAGGRWRR